MNWRGRPLKTHQIIVDLIAGTSTATGLTVHATLDTGQHPTGITYTEKDVAALPRPTPAAPRLPRRMELHAAPQRHTVESMELFRRGPLGRVAKSLSESTGAGFE